MAAINVDFDLDPGGVAEWSCSGLQSRVRRFDSDPRLQYSHARVVKLVDTRDLKSLAAKAACRFDSGLGHHHLALLRDLDPRSMLVSIQHFAGHAPIFSNDSV